MNDGNLVKPAQLAYNFVEFSLLFNINYSLPKAGDLHSKTQK